MLHVRVHTTYVLTGYEYASQPFPVLKDTFFCQFPMVMQIKLGGSILSALNTAYPFKENHIWNHIKVVFVPGI